MSNLRKVYRTLDADLSHAISCKGNRVRILFTGAHPSPKRYGTYITENRDIQEALEADSSFNVLFKLLSQTPLAEKQSVSPTANPAILVATEEGSRSGAETAEEGIDSGQDNLEEELLQVTNFNKAREYLRKTYSIPLSELNNTQAVLAAAAKQGVVFPNWKPAAASISYTT